LIEEVLSFRRRLLPPSQTNSHSVGHIYSNPDMSQPSSSSFRSLFNAALQDYANQTGTKLDDHPLAKQLENCESVDTIYTILQEHARLFQEFRGEDGRIMKSLKCTVHVIHTLSTSTALGEGIGIVCSKSLIIDLCL